MAISWRAPIFAAAVAVVALGTASTASAAPPPAPGIEVDDDDGSCTAGFAAQGDDGSYYLLTSGHCDAGDGAEWTYGQDVPLGRITASEDDGVIGYQAQTVAPP